MLRFEDHKDFPRHAPDVLCDKLSDARFLVRCVPDVHEVKQQERAEAAFVLRPGFAFVRGSLDVTLKVAEAETPSRVRLVLHSRGIGSSADVEVSLALAPLDAGTRVAWVVEVKQLGGLLKAVPQGLISGAARKVVEDAWKAVEARLAEDHA